MDLLKRNFVPYAPVSISKICFYVETIFVLQHLAVKQFWNFKVTFSFSLHLKWEVDEYSFAENTPLQIIPGYKTWEVTLIFSWKSILTKKRIENILMCKYFLHTKIILHRDITEILLKILLKKKLHKIHTFFVPWHSYRMADLKSAVKTHSEIFQKDVDIPQKSGA